MMQMQWSRRFWLVVHEIMVHPIIGVAKILSPSTQPRWASWLHDVTIPPMRREDLEWEPKR